MGKALDAEERLHVCFTINASIISVKHFTCDLFHFRYLFKMRYSSLKCAIIFVVRKQVLCHYFNELYFFVVYKAYPIILCSQGRVMDGMHRVAKAKLRGQDKIDAVQFENDPAPHFVNVNADDLIYDD